MLAINPLRINAYVKYTGLLPKACRHCSDHLLGGRDGLYTLDKTTLCVTV